MMTALTRKSSGSHGVNQSGWSFGPVSSIIVPSEDWCMVGSRSPRARIQTKNRLTKARPFSAKDRRPESGLVRHFSKNAGESSIVSTST